MFSKMNPVTVNLDAVGAVADAPDSTAAAESDGLVGLAGPWHAAMTPVRLMSNRRFMLSETPTGPKLHVL
jgi:hypothetical protein